jgi:plasmid maintenance system killer protein
MEIEFRSKNLKECLENPRQCLKVLGQLAKPTLRRFDQLRAMVSVQELFKSGLDNPEVLKGQDIATISWQISGNYRLEFDLGVPTTADLDSKFQSMTKVFIKGVRDYHGSNKTKPYLLD